MGGKRTPRPSSQIRKLRPTVLAWGPRRKKNANGLPRGCPKSRTIRRGSRGLPHISISHSQLAAFAIETVLPPSSAPRFRQCTLGNAVYLSLPARCTSPLCVLKGLQVPEGCAKTPVVSRGCGLVGETEEPHGRGQREWGWHPQWAASWAEPRPPLATAARRRRGQRNEARSCSQLQVLSPREALDRRAAVAAVAAAAAARAIAWNS